MGKALKVLRSINEKACYVAMVALFLLMILTVVNTLTRKTWIGGIPDSLDMTELFMILIVFCGFAFLESEKGHIRVDMLINQFPKMVKKIVSGILYLASAGILFLFFAAELKETAGKITTGASTQVLSIPHWPFTIIVAIAILLYGITLLAHAIEIFIGSNEKSKPGASMH